MKSILLGVSFLTTAVSWCLPIRQWGFDKDSILETDPGQNSFRNDTISLINYSADTLKVDSNSIEVFTPKEKFQYLTLRLGAPPKVDVYIYSKDSGKPPPNLSRLVVLPNSKLLFSTIFLTAAPIGDSVTLRDTLVEKVVFYSGADADTFFVKGDGLDCCVIAIRPFQPSLSTPHSK